MMNGLQIINQVMIKSKQYKVGEGEVKSGDELNNNRKIMIYLIQSVLKSK